MSEDGRPTSPWNGQATMNSLQAPDAPCLPLRGSVRQNHNRNTMRKLHVAISTNRIEDTIKDYSARFGVEPCAIVEGEYALWRTEALNVSVRQDPTCKPGELRHLGWEDSTAVEFSKDTDINGIVWENFTAQQQANEINEIWPETGYRPRP